MVSRCKMEYKEVKRSQSCRSEHRKEQSSVLHRITEFPLPKVSISGDYDVQKILGEGFFAKILLANERRTNTTVVLKAIHAELTTLKDFYREFHYSYHLSPHPNILSSYAVAFQCDNFYVFAQEVAPFGDLAGAVKAGGLCETFCKRISAQLGSALEFLHSKELVHRDIKLENILLFATDFSKVKLCDFGETRREGALVSKVKCTWQQFLPPEMVDALLNERVINKTASDCWQAAIVLFVCATGSPPWQIAAAASNAEYAMFNKWQKRRTTKIPPQFKNFTPRLLRMFRRLLVHKPEDRAAISELAKYSKDAWFLDDKSGQSTPIERKMSEDFYFNFVEEDDDDDVKAGDGEDGKLKMAKNLSSYGLETTIDQKVMSKRLYEWVLSCETECYDDSDFENY